MGVQAGFRSPAAQVAQERLSVGGMGRPDGVGLEFAEEPLSVRQPPVEQVGLAVAAGQEVPVALDARTIHRFSIPLTIVVT